MQTKRILKGLLIHPHQGSRVLLENYSTDCIYIVHAECWSITNNSLLNTPTIHTISPCTSAFMSFCACLFCTCFFICLITAICGYINVPAHNSNYCSLYMYSLSTIVEVFICTIASIFGCSLSDHAQMLEVSRAIYSKRFPATNQSHALAIALRMRARSTRTG